jgi:hypothetical protein
MGFPSARQCVAAFHDSIGSQSHEMAANIKAIKIWPDPPATPVSLTHASEMTSTGLILSDFLRKCTNCSNPVGLVTL